MNRTSLTVVPDPGVIEIRGARQNNLKGFDLDLPLNRLIVVTGPSGSGKSSLAFDTIYAEGQRRYVETFSPYARQFLDRMDKPKVEEIRGIPPAIAIEQSNPVKSTRSTVGTITEINDYLKVLLPRVVTAQCPSCARPIRPETAKSIVEQIYAQHAGESVLVTFGVPAPAGTKPADFFSFLQQQGYLRAWIEGAIQRLDEAPKVKRLPAIVLMIQDRVTVDDESRARLAEAVETALRFGKGKIAFILPSSSTQLAPRHHGLLAKPRISTFNNQLPFSTGWHCAHCDLDITPPSPGLFSFNHPLGACPTCRGFGRTITIDLERAIPDRSLSIADGVIKPFQTENGRECQRDLLRCAAVREVDVKGPFEDLPKADRDWVLYGERPGASGEELWEAGLWYGVKGFFNWLESKAYKMHVRVLLSRYRTYATCPDCQGGRFQPATLNFRLSRRTVPELMAMPIADLLVVIAHIAAGDSTAQMLREAVASRLRYLIEVGLEYLSLDRPTRTLSGGEIERVNLTTCLGAALVNTLFVLDEPSIGLHPRDTGRLIRVMQNLRDKGNTLLVVEHEEAVMRAADHIIELGPGRGNAGGEVVFNGPLPGLLSVGMALRDLRRGPPREKDGTESLTADYLSGRKSIPIPPSRRTPRASLVIEGAREHNLRDIDVEIPLGVFACVTGVSGSGKSTLVHDVLYRNLLRAKGLPGDETPGACRRISGAQHIDHVVMVDQSPLARTPRSTPALYLGVYDYIRELFASTSEALAQGLTASAFSFNTGGGRCERCGGMGFEKIEMQFLSDVFVRCPECEGRRFQSHVLAIQFRGKSIHDVLGMTVTEAIQFFERTSNTEHRTPNIESKTRASGESLSVGRWMLDVGWSKIVPRLRVLEDVGLGYLTLGQPLNVLSGGESQRLKLVERLTNRSEKNCLLIFDEPTTGLHFDDIALLVRVFDQLVEQGHSLLVIEHNLEIIKRADHIIDLGPEAGARGGLVVATGMPEEIAVCEESHTGRFLRRILEHRTSNIEHRTSNEETLRVAEGNTPRSAEAAVPGTEAAAHGTSGGRQTGEPSGGRKSGEPFRRGGGARNKWGVENGRANPRSIQVHGAREHNLKNISVEIPRDEMVVVTGLSGSGKSTLAFDILFAEGQRRFLDSMSAYARQFIEQLEKPDVDLISGLPPSVAIEQRITRGGGKSTVATVTEVYHFLRLLFAKLGTQFCPKCELPVEKQSLAAIEKRAATLARRSRIRVLAPLIKARKGFHTDVAKWALRQGFEELLVDGKFVRVDRFQKLERFREHSIDVVIGERADAIGRALEIGKGTAKILDARNRLTVLSTESSCPGCGASFEELDPRLFSFNSPHGWCPECRGFGEVWKAYVNPRLETALEIEMDQERQHQWLDEGEAEPCAACGGARLNPLALHVRVQGRGIGEIAALSVRRALDWVRKLKFTGAPRTIAADILPEIAQRLSFMGKVGLDYLSLDRSARTMSGGESQRIRLAAQLGSNLRGVLYVLDEPTIGLHPRDNEALLETLAELKRKGNSLVIVEHDEETMRRADTIIDLGPRAGAHGGEVVAVGSIESIQRSSDSITGRCLREPLAHPTRGKRRPIADVQRWLELRGAATNNLKSIDVRFPIGRFTVITGVSGSGKSSLMRGALKPAVGTALRKTSNAKRQTPNANLRGAEHLAAIYEVDQSPIGKTSRSTPATYLGVFDEIRKLYAQVPVARMRGYTASRFSFNTDGGRCETCAGQGVIKVEMNFLPTSYLPCSECHGSRYNPATLEVLYNGRSIGDVMAMTLEEAAEFFTAHPKIQRALALLCDTGLGYLQLGQPSPTLSGGEAQRLKLVSELIRGTGRAETLRLWGNQEPKSTLYLLEEPTIGLHMADVVALLQVLHRLVDGGHTVIVIEHNISVIADADYVVDIGPEAGEAGGEIVAVGTPEEVAKSKRSRTAPFLRAALGTQSRRALQARAAR
jgi:excinuclease ABC subunit A